MEKCNKEIIQHLRAPEHIVHLEIERVVELSLEKLYVTKVLDLGCGTGLFTEAFGLRKIQTVGVDSNPIMVKMASDLVDEATFREADAEKLPYKNKSFDVVFMAHLLHDSINPPAILEEAKRIAKYRIAILEWPYRSQSFGPPLEERLDPDMIKRIARKAGCIQFEKIALEYMVFYRMTPK